MRERKRGKISKLNRVETRGFEGFDEETTSSPSGIVVSTGQVPFVPEQVSSTSQTPADARQTTPAEANEQDSLQHASEAGSQTAPVRNLQAAMKQS